MVTFELQEELDYFHEHRAELLERAYGKVALIKGRQIAGFFDNLNAACESGAQMFPHQSFLIQEILPEDPVYDNPAYILDLMDARF